MSRAAAVSDVELPEECTIDLTGVAEGRRWLLSHARKGGIGAEFGVFRGHFAAVIADELKPRKLFLVDPWTKSGPLFNWGDMAYTNFNRLTTAGAKADTRHRVRPYAADSEIFLVEDYLEAFVANFAEYSSEKLDFVYLDTSHTYEDAMRQLALLESIVRDDGVILGDDWVPDVEHVHHGVMRAVNDFVRATDWQLVVAGQDIQWCLRRTPQYND